MLFVNTKVNMSTSSASDKAIQTCIHAWMSHSPMKVSIIKNVTHGALNISFRITRYILNFEAVGRIPNPYTPTIGCHMVSNIHRASRRCITTYTLGQRVCPINMRYVITPGARPKRARFPIPFIMS